MSGSAPALPGAGGASRTGIELTLLEAPAGDPMGWLTTEAPMVLDRVGRQGAVVVRGLQIGSPKDLAATRDALGHVPHRATEHFAPREDRAGGIMTPFSWPRDRELCPSQEGSCSLAHPALVLTACARLPRSGSQHYVSDVRRLPEVLPDELVERLRAFGWTVARTFHEGFGMSWQDAFGVMTREELEQVLAREEIDATWLPDGALRTTRHRSAFVDHPGTGESCWFNDLAFLNTGSLDPTEREVMRRAFGQDLPMETTFGDGQPLSTGELTTIQAGYTAVRREVTWQEGDVLVADNLLSAQGRPPLVGSPELLVAIADRRAAPPTPT
ncbi:TauD/TfdA family dioxygenase [Kribbella sp. WER1]